MIFFPGKADECNYLEKFSITTKKNTFRLNLSKNSNAHDFHSYYSSSITQLWVITLKAVDYKNRVLSIFWKTGRLKYLKAVNLKNIQIIKLFTGRHENWNGIRIAN